VRASPPHAGRGTALADELLAAMASIRRSGRRRSGRPVELAELNGSQLELVRLVRRRPGVSVADAAEELRLAPNTVSTLVGQLTDSGMLLRLADESDRRVARLDLAGATRRNVDAWRDRRVVDLAAAMARLPAPDRRRLEEAVPALSRLADLLADDR
jgi:DNA-binding MarR family transcriptional regulator